MASNVGTVNVNPLTNSLGQPFNPQPMRHGKNGIEILDIGYREDGTLYLLDGHGNPLPQGAEPVYLSFAIYGKGLS